MKMILILDGKVRAGEIILKDDIDLKYVEYAILEYGKNEGWFKEEE